jgi:hypothetical protein
MTIKALDELDGDSFISSQGMLLTAKQTSSSLVNDFIYGTPLR